MKELPRGLRNNNPTNLVHVAANKWNGLASPPSDGRFCVFTTMPHGIRAAVLNLQAYQEDHGLHTVEAIIGRWAPVAENNVDAYVWDVSRRMGVESDTPLDLQDWKTCWDMVDAMTWHENGTNTITDAQMAKGLTMAGLTIPPRPFNQSRTVKAGKVAVSTISLATIADAAKEAGAQLQPLLVYGDWIKYGLILSGLVGVGVMLWARLDDHQKGLR